MWRASRLSTVERRGIKALKNSMLRVRARLFLAFSYATRRLTTHESEFVWMATTY